MPDDVLAVLSKAALKTESGLGLPDGSEVSQLNFELLSDSGEVTSFKFKKTPSVFLAVSGSSDNFALHAGLKSKYNSRSVSISGTAYGEISMNNGYISFGTDGTVRRTNSSFNVDGGIIIAVGFYY